MSQTTELRGFPLMRQAERLLRDEGLLGLPVDLESLAKTRDIVIQPMNGPDTGVSGMLGRHGNTFGILYATAIPNKGFQRFSIAHELGHFFVDGHLDHIPFNEGMHQSHAGFVSNDPYEREADYFAAGLLMPKTLVRGIIREQPDGLCAIEAIQHEARASLTASAIRYVGLTESAAAVIVSQGDKIDYCFMSNALKSFKHLTRPRKGDPIPSGTITASIAGQPDEPQRGARDSDEIDAMEWFASERSVQALEEVVGLGSYGRILTVLTCPDLLDEGFMEEDEDSDEALEESWTPRFRR